MELAEMVDRVRREMARRETEMRALLYRWRNEPGAQIPGATIDRTSAELAMLEADRARLDDASFAEVERLATVYLIGLARP
ncbi:MAG TPA: hypothetical protein VGL75_00995 [Acidothermaceae bacterium]|jgi:hypothetical protein